MQVSSLFKWSQTYLLSGSLVCAGLTWIRSCEGWRNFASQVTLQGLLKISWEMQSAASDNVHGGNATVINRLKFINAWKDDLNKMAASEHDLAL